MIRLRQKSWYLDIEMNISLTVSTVIWHKNLPSFFCFAAKVTETPVDSDSTAAQTDESSEDQDDPLKKLTNFAG